MADVLVQAALRMVVSLVNMTFTFFQAHHHKCSWTYNNGRHSSTHVWAIGAGIEGLLGCWIAALADWWWFGARTGWHSCLSVRDSYKEIYQNFDIDEVHFRYIVRP
jgi:hypothetical protein